MTDQHIQSGSQLSRVQECVRDAALHYIDKIRIPSNNEFRKLLGSRIHKINEEYVRHGHEPDETEMMWRPAFNPRTGLTSHKPVFPGQIAAAGFHLLKRGPHGTEGWFTETSIKGVTLPSGIQLTGDMDLAIPELDELRDYKTTTDFGYALTPDSLLTGIQSNLYQHAWFAAIDRGAIKADPKIVNLHWVYLLTKGRPRSHSVRAVGTREQNAAFVDNLDRTLAQPWIGLRKSRTSGYLLPPTGLATGKCEKYNGCAYRGTHCRPTVEESIRYGQALHAQLKGGTDMSGFDLAAILSQGQANQAALAAVPPPSGFGPAPGTNPFGAPAAPVSAPVAPALAGRPSYWMPGDAMNEIQEFAAAKGKPLSFIANAADNPPPPEVAAQYDLAPKPEAGFLNPPEAKTVVPAANPEIAASLAGITPQTPAAALDRDKLKAQCIAAGVPGITQSSRHSAETLAKMLAEHSARPSVPPAPTPVQAAPLAGAYTQAMTEAFTAAQFEPSASVSPVATMPPSLDMSALADAVADRVVARIAAALGTLAK